MFDDLTGLFVTVLGFGVLTLTIAAGFTAAIVRSAGLHRALEHRMAERIALIQRGINPGTLQPFTAGPGPAGDDARAGV